MEFEYKGKQPREMILQRASSHSPIAVDSSQPLLVKGNNFDALSTLLVSGYKGKVDLVYIDPPFNTKQDFTISDSRVSTISRGMKTHVAYSDHMTTQEYIEFIRERLIIIRELMSDEGSIYLHIDNKMGHYLKVIMDEVFGVTNFKNDISRIKSNPKNFKRSAYGNQKDMVLFYAKNYKYNIFNDVRVMLDDNDKKRMFTKADESGRLYNTVPVHAPGETTSGRTGGKWRDMLPPAGRHWRTDPSELDKLDELGLIEWSKNGVPRLKKFADEHTGKKLQDVWTYIDPAYPLYPTEKNLSMLEMIVAQSSRPDSIVLDCFAGSGSTLLAAANLNRQWIGIDQSVHAIKVIKERFKGHDYQFIDLPPSDTTKNEDI